MHIKNIGLSSSPYQQWLGDQVRRILGIKAERGLVVCWGPPIPSEAKATVFIPKDKDFFATAEALPGLIRSFSGKTALESDAQGRPTVRFAVDILSWFGWLISRAEEYENCVLDEFDRFPQKASLTSRLKLADKPVADLLIMLLRNALEQAAAAAGLETTRSSPWPDGKRCAVCLTHDVDHATRRSLWQGATMLAASGVSLLRRRWRQSRRRISEAAGLVRGGAHSPDWMFETMAQLEAARGFRSTFFLMSLDDALTLESGRRVRHYDISREDVFSRFRRLAAEGWELGLHASYQAPDTPQGMDVEWSRLRQRIGKEVPLSGMRNHCLRFRLPESWQYASQAGMVYDATLGWPEGWGFRAATAWPFHPFDRRTSREIPIWEFGVHVMDTYYARLDDLIAKTRETVDCVAEVGGCACLLYHPTPPRIADATVADYVKTYERILDDLAARTDCWVTTPREVIARLAAPADDNELRLHQGMLSG
jgi:hypothetical protein